MALLCFFTAESVFSSSYLVYLCEAALTQSVLYRNKAAFDLMIRHDLMNMLRAGGDLSTLLFNQFLVGEREGDFYFHELSERR